MRIKGKETAYKSVKEAKDIQGMATIRLPYTVNYLVIEELKSRQTKLKNQIGFVSGTKFL